MNAMHSLAILWLALAARMVLSCETVVDVATYTELSSAVDCNSELIYVVANITMPTTLILEHKSNMSFVGSGNSLLYLKMSQRYSMFSITNCTTISFSNLGILSRQRTPKGVFFSNYSSFVVSDVHSIDLAGTMMWAEYSDISILSSTILGSTSESYGGAVYVDTSSVTVHDTTIAHCSSSIAGGAIASFRSSLDIRSSWFDSNVAGDTIGSLSDVYGGGAIYGEGSHVHISNSVFDKNTANGVGGALCLYDTTVMTISSSFTNNIAGSGGAILLSNSRHEMYGSILKSNAASIAGGDGNGGAIFVTGTKVNMVNVSCSDNQSPGSGGCMFLTMNYSLICENCSVTRCSAELYGGGIATVGKQLEYASQLTLFGDLCEISGNEAMAGGGLYFVDGIAFMQGCRVSNNTAEMGAAMYIASNTQVEQQYSTIIHNSARGGSGAGVYIMASVLNSSFCEWRCNSAPNSEFGGGIYAAAASTLYLTGAIMSGNAAGSGSAIAIFDFATLYITDSNITNNVAADSGTIYVRSNSQLDVVRTSVISNDGGTTGGALVCSVYSLCEMKYSSLKSNFAATTGGAIYVELMSTASLWSCTLSDHIANQGGGALFITTYGEMNLYDVQIKSSFSFGKGGAAQVSAYGSLYIYDSLLEGGKSSLGAGIHAEFQSHLTLQNVTFHSNEAQYLGGAISAMDAISINATDVNFYGNSALYGGCLYVLIEVFITMDNFRATSNSATLQGGFLKGTGLITAELSRGLVEQHSSSYGGVFDLSSDGVTVHVDDSILRENSATYEGGVARVSDNCNVLFMNSTLQNNRAAFGGMVFVSAAALNMLDCTVLNNYATDNGGAFNVKNGNITLSRSRFEYNTAAEEGGLMLAESSTTLRVISSLVTRSSVNENGGAFFFSDGCNVEFLFSNFSDNRADGLGGVVYDEKYGSYSYVGCNFSRNNAMGGAAMYGTKGSAVFFESSILESNSASDYALGGAVLLENPISLDVRNSVFVNSTGGVGGAIHVEGLDTSVTSSVLGDTSNTVGDTVLQLPRVLPSQSESSPISIRRSTFIDSRFVDALSPGFNYDDTRQSCVDSWKKGNGGAIAFVGIPVESVIQSSYFKGNEGCHGAGLFASLSKTLVNDTVFEKNVALLAGGGIYWEIEDNDPSVSMVTTLNTLDVQNSADYGTLAATNSHRLSTLGTGTQSSGEVLNSPFVISIEDYYNQTIVTDNKTVMIAISRDESVVSGSTIELAHKGVVCFDELKITGQIGGSATIAFASLTGSDAIMYVFQFRSCVVGEIYQSAGKGSFNEDDDQELSTCYKCPSGTYALRSTSTICKPCPDFATCPGGNVIIVDEGYWRSDNESADILECRGTSAKACVGGGDGGNVCSIGNTGPYCAVCEDEYTKQVDGTCNQCASQQMSDFVLAMLICIPIVIIFVVGVLYIMRDKIREKFGEFYETVQEKMETQGSKLKILFAFVQILSQFPGVLGTPPVPVYSTLSSYLGVVSFDFLDYFKLDCEYKINFYNKLVFVTMFPIFITPFLFAYFYMKHFISKRLNANNPDFTIWDAKRQSTYWFLAMIFAIFSPASTVILQTFVCERFDDGSVKMAADYSLNCQTSEYRKYVSFASVMILVYPIGIPLLYLTLLHRNLKKVNPPTKAVVKDSERHIVSAKIIQLEKLNLRNNDESISHLSFLFESYRPGAWYFEVIECMRRLLLTAVPSLILKGTAVQTIIILIFSLCFTGLYAELKPFVVPSDSLVALISEWGVTLTLLLGLVLRVGEQEDSVDSQGATIVGIVMVAVNLGIVFFTCYTSVYNDDDKHSAALSKFKESKAKKKRSSTSSLEKRSSRVNNLFVRFSNSMKRFSANNENTTNTTPQSATVHSPFSSSIEMSSQERPKTTLSSDNLRARIQQRISEQNTSVEKDSDDDSDSDDDGFSPRQSSTTVRTGSIGFRTSSSPRKGNQRPSTISLASPNTSSRRTSNDFVT